MVSIERIPTMQYREMLIHIHKVGTELWFLATDIVKALEKYCNLNFDSYVSNVQQLTKWVPPEYKRTERFMAPLGTIKRVLLNRVGVGVALNTVCVDEARKMYEWCKNVVYPSQGVEAPRDDAILVGMAGYQRKNGWRLPPNTAEIEPDHLVEAPEEPGKNEGAELQTGDGNASIPRVFENPQFGSVRTIIKDGEPWFVAADVCMALGIGNSSTATARLNNDDKCTHLIATPRGAHNRTIINESGLCWLVFGSRKPKAKEYKKWIIDDVIPILKQTKAPVVDDENGETRQSVVEETQPFQPLESKDITRVFESVQFGSVRAMMRNGEPWFVATDVCRALEVQNITQALSRLDEDERSMLNIGRQGNANIVNEPGLYTLVLGSRKPEAKAFKRWVTHEVIPSIRKTGGYIAGQDDMSDAELLSRAILVAQRQIEQRDLRIRELEPKAQFADDVSGSPDSISVGELAKLLKQNGVDIGKTRLFAWLRGSGYLIKAGDEYNMPSQRSMDAKLFEIKETLAMLDDGTRRLIRTPMVTGRGQRYFLRRGYLIV